jgi:hypothetical protein
MRICYVPLSPTFGMQQYTAHLANRMSWAGHKVSLVTTRHYLGDRYLPKVRVRTPVGTREIDFPTDTQRFSGARAAQAEIGISGRAQVRDVWRLPGCLAGGCGGGPPLARAEA